MKQPACADKVNSSLKTAISDHLAKYEMGKRTLALKAGLHPSAVINFLADTVRAPRIDTVAALADAMNMSVDDMIGRPREKPLDRSFVRDITQGVIEATAELGLSAADQAELVARIYEHFTDPRIPQDPASLFSAIALLTRDFANGRTPGGGPSGEQG